MFRWQIKLRCKTRILSIAAVWRLTWLSRAAEHLHWNRNVHCSVVGSRSKASWNSCSFSDQFDWLGDKWRRLHYFMIKCCWGLRELECVHVHTHTHTADSVAGQRNGEGCFLKPFRKVLTGPDKLITFHFGNKLRDLWYHCTVWSAVDCNTFAWLKLS